MIKRDIKTKYGPAIGARFDSTTELAEFVRAEIGEEVFKGVTRGDNALVPRADKLLDKIETIEKLAEHMPRVENAVTGGLANVPAYLMGSPVAMRRKRRQEEKAPLTICVSSVTSAGIGGALIERRGAAVLALLRKLETAGHAVSLYVTAGMNCSGGLTTFTLARMDSQPIDIARTAWTLGDEKFQRRVMFETGAKLSGGSNSYIHWPYNNSKWNTAIARQQEVYAELLDVTPETVLIVPPVYLDEQKNFDSDASAVAWLNRRYAEASEIHLINP
jgi:hypothetical protein